MLFCVVGLSKMDIQELGRSCLLLCFDFESNNRLCKNEMNGVYERWGAHRACVSDSLLPLSIASPPPCGLSLERVSREREGTALELACCKYF